MSGSKYNIPDYALFSNRRAESIMDTESEIPLQTGGVRFSYVLPLIANSILRSRRIGDVVDENVETEINKRLRELEPKFESTLPDYDEKGPGYPRFETMQVQLARIDGLGIAVEVLSRIAEDLSEGEIKKIRTQVRLTISDIATGAESILGHFGIRIDEGLLSNKKEITSLLRAADAKYDIASKTGTEKIT
jgi:hypothetical protein